MMASRVRQEELSLYTRDHIRQTLLSSGTPQTSPAKPMTVQGAVYYIMDWKDEFRERSSAFDKERLWKLTHQVGALLGRAVNPETVARRRRDYWNKVINNGK